MHDLDESSVGIIYDLYHNNKFEGNSDYSAVVLNYLGIYFKINGNEELMLKYYQLATEKGNIHAVSNLAHFYRKQKNMIWQ
mgnify:CR=1 FL=1